VPTDTPPPYFPQNQLSPGDEKTAKKLRLTFYGCIALLVLAGVALVVGIVYLIHRLF
jgi:tetrahydromethanopterin S-methyltransferase subunit B